MLASPDACIIETSYGSCHKDLCYIYRAFCQNVHLSVQEGLVSYTDPEIFDIHCIRIKLKRRCFLVKKTRKHTNHKQMQGNNKKGRLDSQLKTWEGYRSHTPLLPTQLTKINPILQMSSQENFFLAEYLFTLQQKGRGLTKLAYHVLPTCESG